MAQVAYKLAMPRMESLPSIRAYIAAIAQGINSKSSTVATAHNSFTPHKLHSAPSNRKEQKSNDHPPPHNRTGPGARHLPRMRQGPRTTPRDRSMVHKSLHRCALSRARQNRPAPETTEAQVRNPRTHELTGLGEQQGPLVRQPAPAARLARILHHSANDLWELCTLTDTNQMQQEANAIARRIIASHRALTPRVVVPLARHHNPWYSAADAPSGNSAVNPATPARTKPTTAPDRGPPGSLNPATYTDDAEATEEDWKQLLLRALAHPSRAKTQGGKK